MISTGELQSRCLPPGGWEHWEGGEDEEKGGTAWGWRLRQSRRRSQRGKGWRGGWRPGETELLAHSAGLAAAPEHGLAQGREAEAFCDLGVVGCAGRTGQRSQIPAQEQPPGADSGNYPRNLQMTP